VTARRFGEAVNLGGFRRLLDIGGGSGAYDIELCKQYGTLRATVSTCRMSPRSLREKSPRPA
jgi:hypothetical protein